MNLLIAYATTDGQTRKIVRFIADRLVARGHGVELVNTDDTEGLDLTRFDGAILAGSIHTGHFQKSLRRFASEAQAALAAIPTLFLSVSLAAAGNDPEDWADLKKCQTDFQAETGWAPTRTEYVAGAFRFSEYDFFRAWAMRRIADMKGQKIEPGKDKEYTDWDQLTLAVDGWLSGLKPRVKAAAASTG